MSKHFITITDENLYNDIVEYCRLNNEKVNNFCQRILKEQLMIEKYGDTPFGGVAHEFKLPPVGPIDANTKDIFQPQIDSMVDEYTKDIHKKIIDEMKTDNIEKKKIRRL